MKIAFFTHYASLYGANRSLINLAEGLTGRGCNIFLVSPIQGPVTEYFSDRGFPVLVHPFPQWFIKTAAPEQAVLRRLRQTQDCLSKITEQLKKWHVDLVYTNSSVIDIGLLAAKQIKRPHVWHIREYGDLDYGLRPDAGQAIFKRLLHGSEALVFISQSLASYILPSHRHPCAHIIHNGVCSEAYIEAVLRNDKKRSKRTVDTFALVGLVNGKKGHAVAIEAFAKVITRYPKAKLLLAGGGKLEELRKHIQAVGAADNICVLGEVVDPFGIFLNADVALMCSQHEAMGRVTAEAMACACPVIGFKGGATPELIEHGCNGLLYDGGHEALADCMFELIEDPAATRKMGRNAQQTARARFTVAAYTKQVQQVIATAAAQPQGARPYAMSLPEACPRIDEKHSPIWGEYTRLLDGTALPGPALKIECRETAPKYPATHPSIIRAEAAAQEGNLAEAEKILAGVLSRDACNVEALNDLAYVAYQQGNVLKAFESVSKAKSIAPGNPDTIKNEAAIRKALALDSPDLPMSEQSFRKSDSSTGHGSGADIQPPSCGMPKMQQLNEEELHPYATKPIFIVGCSRSGTTLLRKLLNTHSAIFCPPCETFLFNTLDSTFNGDIWETHYKNLPFSRGEMIVWLRTFVLQLFANLGKNCGKKRWAEKTPSHSRFMPFIDEVFPDAQFIHIIRNGLNVVNSLQKMPWATSNIVDNTKKWTDAIGAARAAGKKLGPDRYMEIRYEELLSCPQMVIREMCAFLQEDDYDSIDTSIIKPTKAKPVTLTTEEQNAFQESASDLMQELGYEHRTQKAAV